MAEIIPLYAVRVADLARGNIEVVAMCGACGHRGIVPPETIRRRLPDKAPILRLRGKLRCALCGGAGDVMTRTLPEGDPFRVPPRP
jgi:hypothetical protein